jgi:sugar/nucleoside kinase (ribokinase family)
MIDAIAAGHVCVDITPQITDAATAASASFLAPGRLTEVGGAIIAPGGAVSNTGLAMHVLGLEVRLVARVGDDVIADITRQLLAARGERLVDGLTVARGEPSSYTVVISAPGFDRTFLHCTGTNDTFGHEDISPALLDQARLLHFGYPTLMRRMYAEGEELAAIYELGKAHGVTTSLDLAMPDPTRASGKADWRTILGRALPRVDLFLPSVEELLFMLRRERYEALLSSAGPAGMLDALTPDDLSDLGGQALDLGAQVVVIKCGHRGIYARSAPVLRAMGRGAPAEPAGWAGRELWAPCFRPKFVNAVGAGDSAIAGCLTGLLRGQSLAGAVTSAVATGAYNCEAPDTNSGLRGWEETQARIRVGWERSDAGVRDARWRWDSALGLLLGPNDSAR